jgi:hypothetical protein
LLSKGTSGLLKSPITAFNWLDWIEQPAKIVETNKTQQKRLDIIMAPL